MTHLNNGTLTTLATVSTPTYDRSEASVGIVHFDHHADLDALLRDADAALYLAKAKGRGRWWMAPRE